MQPSFDHAFSVTIMAVFIEMCIYKVNPGVKIEAHRKTIGLFMKLTVIEQENLVL